MFELDYVEFYITNVCNLNCSRCNRFNNYAFSGHMSWQDNARDYREWSKKIRFNRIGILGGEPMSHPDFLTWIKEIATLWPDSQIMIMSNGTHLRRYPMLFDFLKSWSGRIRLDISRHNLNARSDSLSDIEDFFTQGYEKFRLNSEEEYAATGVHGYRSTHDDLSWHEIVAENDKSHIWSDKSWQFVYVHDGIVVRYADADCFDESVVRLDPTNKNCYLTSELTDPASAAAKCMCKYSHHFLHGKLYKCGITAVLPEFAKQFHLRAPKHKIDLIDTYLPASWQWSDHDLAGFLQGLRAGQAIPQCALCPDKFTSQKFAAGNKKIKIERKGAELSNG